MNEQARRWFHLGDSGWLTLVFVLWLTMAGMPVTVVLVAQAMFHLPNNGYLSYLALGIGELSMILPLIAYMALRNIPPRALLGAHTTVPQNLLAALIGVLAAGAVMGLNVLMDLLSRRIGLPSPDESWLEPTSWGLALVGLIAVGGTAGVVEEPLFRGVVLRSMGAIRGRRWAIVVSAAAFSLIHMDLIGAPTRFVVGLLLAMLTWRAGGILPSVFAHAAYNGAALFTGFLGNRYFPDFSSFSFLRDLPAGGAEVLTWVLLSLPFAAAVWGCWRLYCRVSPGQGWRDRPHLPNPGGTAVLPWGILALVTASYTAVNTILLWYLPRLGQLLPSGFGG